MKGAWMKGLRRRGSLRTPPNQYPCPTCQAGYATAADASLCGSTHRDPDLDPSDIWADYDETATYNDQGETR